LKNSLIFKIYKKSDFNSEVNRVSFLYFTRVNLRVASSVEGEDDQNGATTNRFYAIKKEYFSILFFNRKATFDNRMF
jgi:hypothetical protein